MLITKQPYAEFKSLSVVKNVLEFYFESIK